MQMRETAAAFAAESDDQPPADGNRFRQDIFAEIFFTASFLFPGGQRRDRAAEPFKVPVNGKLAVAVADKNRQTDPGICRR